MSRISSFINDRGAFNSKKTGIRGNALGKKSSVDSQRMPKKLLQQKKEQNVERSHQTT